MNIDNTTFVEYTTRDDLINIFMFIEIYEYDDVLCIDYYDCYIKCIKLEIKLYNNSNEGHNIKYLFIYKIF
jgi:hypothetical protein